MGGDLKTHSSYPQQTVNRRVRRSTATLLAACALFAAACGSDNNSSSGTAAPSSTTATWHHGTRRICGSRRLRCTDRLGRGADRRAAQGDDRDHAQRRRARRTRTSPTRPSSYAELHQRPRRHRRPSARGHRLRRAVRPAVATTCARQAVDEGMVSIVGSFTFFAESIVPVIAESNITWFGACCPITPSELTEPVLVQHRQPADVRGRCGQAGRRGRLQEHQRRHHRRRPDLHPADGERDDGLRHEVR